MSYQPFDPSILTRPANFARGKRGGTYGGTGSTEGSRISSRSDGQQALYYGLQDRLRRALEAHPPAFQRMVTISRASRSAVHSTRALEISDANKKPIIYVINGRLGVGGGLKTPSDLEFVPPGVRVTVTEAKVSGLTFRSECTAAYSGQVNMVLRAYGPEGELYGYIEYVEFERKPSIRMLKVMRKYRRKGVATALMRELQKEYPDVEIETGGTTNDGSKFMAKLPSTYVKNNRWDEIQARLTLLKQELAQAEAEIDRWRELPDDERNRTREKVLSKADKMNSHYDEIYELEKELEDTPQGKRLVNLESEARARVDTLLEANWLLYHYTNLDAAAKIVKDKEFHLRSNQGASSEQNASTRKYYYFLSTSRLPESGYNLNMYPRNHHAIFVLNGQRVATRYAIKPVSYWGPAFTSQSDPYYRRRSDETEDRILSNKDTLPLSMADSLHIFSPTGGRDDDSRLWRLYRTVSYLNEQRDIPVFWYDNMEAFRHLNTSKCVPAPEPIKPGSEEPEEYKGGTRTVDSVEELCNFLEKPVNDTGFSYRHYEHDAVAGAACDVHNLSSNHSPAARAAIARLMKILRKQKSDLATAVRKAYEIKNAHRE